MKIGFLAMAAMVFATGAVAAPPSNEGSEPAASTSPAEQAATTSEPAADPADEKKVCRTERATGSLTRRTRVCMTAAQWREINAKTYRGVTEMQGSASGSQAIVNNPGAGG